MPFHIINGDITTIECDAIVNSLGTDNTIFGRLCENIVEASRSEELDVYLHGLKHSEINQIYVTRGFALPCKNIIHIATPYKYLDHGNELLKAAYKKILYTALDNNFRNICIPYIGTGANGYNDEEAYDAATSVCAEFTEKYDDLDIRLVLNKKTRHPEARILEAAGCLRAAPIEDYKENPKREVSKVLSFNKELQLKQYERYYVPKCRKYDNPVQFIDEFVEEKPKLKKEINDIIGNKYMSLYRNNKKEIPKEVFLAIAYLSRMDFSTFKLYLMMFGYTLSPYSNLDCFYFDYFTGRIDDVENFVDLNREYGELYDGESLISYYFN